MNSDLNWSNQRRTRITLALFAVIVAVAIVAAFATTLHRVDTRQASSDLPPGTIGLAHPHPPLDKSPGNPVK
jgi:ABC-type phosphate/phosphonate transport system permease subunit